MTRLKDAEGALREAERLLLDAQQVGQLRAWEEDLRTGMVRVDTSAFTGADEIHYQSIPREEAWKDVHPGDVARLVELRRKTLQTGEPFETEYRLARPGAPERFLLVRGNLLRGSDGLPARVVGVTVDITGRKRAEEEARQTQRLLRLVLDTLPVGVAVMDRGGNVIASNPATSRIWGGLIPGAQERYSQSVGYWHETGKRIEPAEWASQSALHQGETRLNQLVDIESFDGRRRIIRNSAAPIRDEQQQIVGAVVVNEEVTERVRAEEELGRRARQQTALARLSLSALKGDDLGALFEEAVALVVETLGVEYSAVLEWLPDSQVMEFRAGAGPWANEVIRRVAVPTGPGSMAGFYMRSKTPVVVEDLLRETRFSPCELLVEHGVRSGVVVPISGRERPFGVVEANARSARGFTDDEVGFVWGVANILATSIEQRRSASELAEKRAQLQSLSRKLIEAQEAERRAIARELHDDFGQVLTALKLSLQRRERDEAESIALVDGAIERMRDLAQDLRPPLLDELGLESSLRWYVEREANRAGLKFSLALAPLGPSFPPAVATTCFRVVQEALTNIVRHAQAQRVEVELRQEEGHLLLLVRDDGRGFDVAAARQRAARGESQGLLSMQERVELAGGRLEIESAPGRGAALRARLPLAGGGAS